MPNIIETIDSFPFGKIQLFFDEARLVEEARLNLASFPASRVGLGSENENGLIRVLQKAISRMEVALGAVLSNRRAIFYMWHDGHANLLRWSVISDLGQTKLPFSSNVHEVDIKTVVTEWTRPRDKSALLSMGEIERMTAAELRIINKARGVPTINAYVRRVPDATK